MSNLGMEILILSLIVLFSGCLAIEFRTHPIFQSNMVLQRAPYKAVIYGTANPGSKVYAELESKTYSGITDGSGSWKVALDPHAENDRAYTIKLTNSDVPNIISLTNLLFGDIYICSGQSNMGLNIKNTLNATETFEESKTLRNLIRLFTMNTNSKDKGPSEDIDGHIRQNWTVISPEGLGIDTTEPYSYFSATCYYTGLTIFKATRVPIGMIVSAVGATIVESWMPESSLSKCTELTKNPEDPSAVYSSLYNGMIFPFLKLTIRGAFWYQGETNVGNHGNYTEHKGFSCAFAEMINGWREAFSNSGLTDKEFPFGFVQLAGYCKSDDHHCTNKLQIAELRYAQTADYGYAPNPAMKNVFMATAIDFPDPLIPSPPLGDIHPRNKLPVGLRLGHAALNVIYKANTDSITGPLVQSCSVINNKVKLYIKSDSITSEALVQKDNFGFEILSSEEKWIHIEVSEVADTYIELSTTDYFDMILGVRYLWSDNPCCPDASGDKTSFSCPQNHCSIYSSKTDLPMLPFRYYINFNMCVME